MDTVLSHLPDLTRLDVLISTGKVAIFALYIVLVWKLIDRLTPFDDSEELFKNGNWAYLMQRLSLAAAQGFAMLSAVGPSSDNPLIDLGWQAVEGLWILVILLSSRWIIDKILLRPIDNLLELKNGNRAVGIIEAGFYTSIGLIIGGTLMGEAENAAVGFMSTGLFTVLGVLSLIILFYFHEWVTSYDVVKNICQGSTATALEAAGALVALGFVLRAAVSGNFTGWTSDVVLFGVATSIGIVTLYVFRWLIDRFILTNCSVRSIQEGQLAVPAATMAGLFVVLALPVSTVVSLLVSG